MGGGGANKYRQEVSGVQLRCEQYQVYVDLVGGRANKYRQEVSGVQLRCEQYQVWVDLVGGGGLINTDRR